MYALCVSRREKCGRCLVQNKCLVQSPHLLVGGAGQNSMLFTDISLAVAG